jgi:hypothetical protein
MGRTTGVRFSAGEFFSSSQRQDRLWGPTQPPIQWLVGDVSSGGGSGRLVKLITHLHLVARQEWWSYTSTTPHAFMSPGKWRVRHEARQECPDAATCCRPPLTTIMREWSLLEWVLREIPTGAPLCPREFLCGKGTGLTQASGEKPVKETSKSPVDKCQLLY